METIRFVLNGCDISFTAVAPKDITLEQLLKQCDRIYPDWCACGICSYDHLGYSEDVKVELEFSYTDVRKTEPDVSCKIKDSKTGSFKAKCIKDYSIYVKDYIYDCEVSTLDGKYLIYDVIAVSGDGLAFGDKRFKEFFEIIEK